MPHPRVARTAGALLVFLIVLSAASASAGTTRRFPFEVGPRAAKSFSVDVPAGAAQLVATLSEHSEMLTLAVFAPGRSEPACHGTTWTSPNWRDPVRCVVTRPAAGTYRLEIEGAVHVTNVPKVNAVAGVLAVEVTGGAPVAVAPAGERADESPGGSSGHPPQTNPAGTSPTGTPLPLPGRAALIEAIASGRPFAVVFDLARFDDSGYAGSYKTDPMGTLKAGESYRVVYRDGRFSCTGLSEHAGSVITSEEGGADPRDGLVSLWGRVYAIDGRGLVWDPEYGIVGHVGAE
jgi:hypothetical protein